MKITEIVLDRLRIDLDPPFRAAWDPQPRRFAGATLVRVHTDEGLVGIGSGDTMDGFEAFAHLFVGTDPTAMARHVQVIESIGFHAGRYWPLEAALWDLVGRIHDVPVAQLFGNASRRVPAYASTGELKSVEERVATALAAQQAGFRAMKLRVPASDPAAGIAAVAAVRDALGPDFTLMADLNQSWRMAGDTTPALDRVTVRRTVDRLAELGVHWVEEPLPYDDRSGLADLRRSSATRIAGGEMLRTFGDALGLLEQDALDVYQMDVVLSLGMSRCRTFAELARQRHRVYTPHTWTNGIGLLANLHVAAGVGGAPWLEYPWDPDGWTAQRRDFMLEEPVGIEDGALVVPERPGLGVVLDEDAVARARRPVRSASR